MNSQCLGLQCKYGLHYDKYIIISDNSIMSEVIDDDEIWKSISTDDEIIEVIKTLTGKKRLRAVEILLQHPKDVNITKIITSTIGMLINQVDLLQLFVNTGKQVVFRDMENSDRQNIFNAIKYMNLDFLKLFSELGFKNAIMNYDLKIQDFNDVNYIYYLLDEKLPLSFSNLKPNRTLDEIRIMIHKAWWIKDDSLHLLVKYNRLQELYSYQFIVEMINKGAKIHIKNDGWDLLPDLLQFIDDNERDKIIHLFDINKSFENYILSSFLDMHSSHPRNASINDLRLYIDSRSSRRYYVPYGKLLENALYFIKKGASTNNFAIIDHACRIGHDNLVKLLFSLGSTLEFNMRAGRSVLCTALIYEHYDLAQLLINRGADTTHALMFIAGESHKLEFASDNTNRLLYVSGESRFQQIKFLIDRGANPVYIIYNLTSNDPVIVSLLAKTVYSPRTKELLSQYNIK